MIHGYLKSYTPQSSAASPGRWWHSHSSLGQLSGSVKLLSFSEALEGQCQKPFSKEHRTYPPLQPSSRESEGTTQWASATCDVRSKQMVEDSRTKLSSQITSKISHKIDYRLSIFLIIKHIIFSFNFYVMLQVEKWLRRSSNWMKASQRASETARLCHFRRFLPIFIGLFTSYDSDSSESGSLLLTISSYHFISSYKYILSQTF